jgi:uncharacterized protein YbjT (DUF2867 family)
MDKSGSNEMILVTGATGTVGSELVRQLVLDGQVVRVMTRNPQPHRLPKEAEVVTGDFAQLHTLSQALQGVRQAFLLTTGDHIPRYDAGFAAAAKKAGVQRVTKLSALGVGYGSQDAITRWHRAGEEAIKNSGVTWTFLRPGGFMSNALGWADSIKSQGAVYAPFGSEKVAIVDPWDIAAVAACVLTQPGHEGKVYEISGAEALTIKDQVTKLGDSIGRSLRFVDVPPEAALRNMERSGMPPGLAEGVIGSLAQAKEAFSSEIRPTVKKVTGHDPRSFDQWVQAHQTAFEGGYSPVR